tara:strand:- start:1519 stop:2367 length:849 start_codon:yes stop_codon:yes gene_type:complete
MQHRAELAVHKYLTDAVSGSGSMGEDTIEQIATDIKDALHRQFNSKQKRKYSLRMSSIGRPSCQQWFEKNHPDKALPKPTTFVMNMMIGDIVEAIFKGLLKEAKIDFTDSEKVELKVGKDTITGTYDLILDGAVDDIKSASSWSYKYKFDSYDALKQSDGFGYVGQLAGYAKATNSKVGGWWVINKANGEFKYVPATGIEIEDEISKMKDTIKSVETKELVRCFEPEPELFRGKATGNTVLNKNCTFCDFRHSCWETIQELPAQMSKAKEPKIVPYISLGTS